MSINPSSAALRRDEAIIEEPPQAVSVPLRDLADTAAALARIESLVAGDGLLEPNSGDALERIADIAFVLHERDVEASLSDALDAAVRDIAAAGARDQERVQRIRQAAQMLRDLSRRVGDLIAQAETGHRAAPARTAGAMEGELAAAVALRPREAEAASTGWRGAGDVTALPSAHAEQVMPLVVPGADADVAEGRADLRPAAGTAEQAIVLEATAGLLDEDFVLPAKPGTEAIAHDGATKAITLREAPSRALLPTGETLKGAVALEEPPSKTSAREGAGARALLNPADDPDDLFEPIGSSLSPITPAPVIDTAPMEPAPPVEAVPIPETTAAAAAAILVQPAEAAAALAATAEAEILGVDSSVSGSNPAAPRAAAAAAPPTVPRAAPRDPLAAIRALSDEEMIALFT